MAKIPSETVPTLDEAARVAGACWRHGAHAVHAASRVSLLTMLRCSAALPVKRSRLLMVLAAVDKLDARRAAALKNSDERGRA